jgi:hypothetical protein
MWTGFSLSWQAVESVIMNLGVSLKVCNYVIIRGLINFSRPVHHERD